MIARAGRFVATFLPPFVIRKGNMGNKQEKEMLVQLRKNALSKKEYLSRLQQLSWRIKKVEELYPINSSDSHDLVRLVSEYDDIYGEFMHIAQLELGCADYIPYSFDERKGGQDEK